MTGDVVDLTNCDREPIHVLGAIQSFGLLIAVSADWMISRASANIGRFLGVEASEVLGRPILELLDREAVHQLRNMVTMLRGADAVERAFALRLREGFGLFDVAVHFSGPTLVIEAEPATQEGGDSSALVRSMITRVRQAQSMQQFLQEAARQVRAVTGFDRVMVYRFDQSGSGEVVAEARRAGVDTFLGLNYPASDIPVQARALYLRNLFRVIADVDAEPAPLIPQFDAAGAPLDLSMSVLRSVSPIHIEYLRNMGVGASLSISIVVEGRLWGLFACHHYAPHRPSFADRTSAELFGSMFSLMLEGRERAAVADFEASGRSIADRLMAVIAQDESRMADSEWLGSIVADAIPCDGVGVLINGDISLSGLTPDEGQFRGVVSLLNRQSSGRVATIDHIAAQIPEAVSYAQRAAGFLAIPISRTPRDYVVLFRSERLRSVRWAGNPEKPASYGPNGERLTPRKSFEEWSELVKGKATPFTAAEMRVAETVRGALIEVVLRMSDAAGEERRRAEERQELLIAELNHRVRNILALIRGLVGQSRQKEGTAAEILQTLDDRVLALARAHDQITADQWGPGGLRTLIETEIGAFLGARRDRVELSGTDVKLGPEAFTSVALVIHELVTNAAKHGALSDNGSVQVAWRRGATGELLLEWRERGGPIVSAPTRRGFGSTITERLIPHELGGRAEVRFVLTGLEADFAIPERFVVDAGSLEPAYGADVAPAEGGEASPLPLAGKCALLLEDSLLIAVDCEAALRQLGAHEVRVASSVEDAMDAIAASRFDFAILDVNLGSETSIPVADALAAQGTPFVFATGYGEGASVPPPHGERLTLSKPYTAADLGRAILSALDGRAGPD